MYQGEIIINADDFGIDEDTAQIIINFIVNGYCDTATVMVNMEHWKNTSKLVRDNNLMNKIGLHINLTQGKPITKKILNSDVFCKNGKLGQYKVSRTKRFILNQAERTMVQDEIRAQIERYLESGYKGMHMDSHQGIHMDWAIYPIVLRLFDEYGFQTLRRSPNLKDSKIRSMIRLPYDGAIKRAGINCTDYLGNIEDFCTHISKIKAHRTVEIMCHPKRVSDIEYFDYYNNFKLETYIEVLEKIKHISKLNG